MPSLSCVFVRASKLLRFIVSGDSINLMHRDIKMQNMYVRNADDLTRVELVVGDFGGAQRGEQTVNSALVSYYNFVLRETTFDALCGLLISPFAPPPTPRHKCIPPPRQGHSIQGHALPECHNTFGSCIYFGGRTVGLNNARRIGLLLGRRHFVPWASLRRPILKPPLLLRVTVLSYADALPQTSTHEQQTPAPPDTVDLWRSSPHHMTRSLRHPNA